MSAMPAREPAFAWCLLAGVLLGLALACGAAGGEAKTPGPVLLFPGVSTTCRMKLEVLLDGASPEVAWNDFLDRLFDYFDREHDDSLSQAEVSRMFPLPLPGRKELLLTLKKLDADGNGTVSRAELKSFCRSNGFAPIVVVTEGPSADDLRLGESLLGWLDTDADGKLTRAELGRAPLLLRKLDLNEDEFLDVAELLASAPPARRAGQPLVRLMQADAPADVVLRLNFTAKAAPVTLEGPGAGSLCLVDSSSPSRRNQLHARDGHWSAGFRLVRTLPDARSAGEFLAAQLQASLGDREALPKMEMEQDPSLHGLRELFPFADQNGDNRLSLAELQRYFDLVEQGVRAQVWIKVMERARNPFLLLDTDGDGRLSYQELARAADVLGKDRTEANSLPWQVELSFSGSLAPSWGGVKIPVTASRLRRDIGGPAPAPRWFQALDRNRDGVLSPSEFLGPPELFRRYDADGDGVISPQEAQRYESR